MTDTAQVGDLLELRFEIFDERSPYEIFVRDLLAKDGNDQNQVRLGRNDVVDPATVASLLSQIALLDSEGCPTEAQIMGPLLKDPENPKVLVANFDAFKFPTSQVSATVRNTCTK